MKRWNRPRASLGLSAVVAVQGAYAVAGFSFARSGFGSLFV
ncbi:hypothetical protein [Neobacillus notoginsengisoli]|nr:hypothetical protein [Neobacillus notoginsengisoli]